MPSHFTLFGPKLASTCLECVNLLCHVHKHTSLCEPTIFLYKQKACLLFFCSLFSPSQPVDHPLTFARVSACILPSLSNLYLLVPHLFLALYMFVLHSCINVLLIHAYLGTLVIKRNDVPEEAMECIIMKTWPYFE
ncbi:hypothetical protein BS78_06G061300 [Paspalum vaginatum]|nr:hypothetical protein BS78_06G061300 [Paspalum vaginatum]